MGISHILFGSAVAHVAVIDFELVAIFVGGFADGWFLLSDLAEHVVVVFASVVGIYSGFGMRMRGLDDGIFWWWVIGKFMIDDLESL